MDPPPPVTLMEELVEEFLIRIPPEDPASLVRAALVCKRWCRLISGASFRRRFRELHPAPPMLGFLYQHYSGVEFVPAASFRPPHAFRGDWRVLDARHGRVLVVDMDSSSLTETEFIVWDPVTDGLQKLSILEFWLASCGAALLCATAGCDHLDCHGGPFVVVVVITDDMHGEKSTHPPMHTHLSKVPGANRSLCSTTMTVSWDCTKPLLGTLCTSTSSSTPKFWSTIWEGKNCR